MKTVLLSLALSGILLTGCESKHEQEQTKNAMNAPSSKNSESDQLPSLRIVRHFDVLPEVVFDAFTKPEAMQVWWTETTTFEIDLRVGGRWTITRKEGETVYTATGEYLEIEKPRRLTYTYAMPQFSPNTDTISITIDPSKDTGCVLTFEQTGKDIASELREVPAGSSSNSEQGWNYAFDLMAAAWEKNRKK